VRYGDFVVPDRLTDVRLERDIAPGAAAAELDTARAFVARGGAVDAAIAEAREALLAHQAPDGHWAFPLEADATIPAEYILLEHFLDDIDDEVEQRLANYLRRTQGADGGWPLFAEGGLDVSATVKAYFALKLAGDSPDEPHMRRAREAVLARGGGARCNVFTRFTLALWGQVPWRAVPIMPVEIMHLPRWSFFHLSKVSYWSRTVIVPLIVLAALKPRARNPRRFDIRELFVEDPFEERSYLVNPTGAFLGEAFLFVDRVLRWAEPFFPESARRRAIDKAMSFTRERLNGEDGLGGIFPAMANTLMAFDALGVSRNDPDYATARRAVRKLLLYDGDEAMCQPCLSPVWDTALAALALIESGENGESRSIDRAVAWLVGRQVTDVRGDWSDARPDLAPGGWPFQYRNDYYPDTDDSAAVLMALEKSGRAGCAESMRTGIEWILGMQSRHGGWGAFDAENTHAYLNHIPFADHGALLDPPTADVTARCVGMLAQCGLGRDHPAVARGLAFLRRVQEPDGSWYGRWGTNYVYGTWSVLSAFAAAGEDPQAPHIRRAVAWLESRQREDGGWGEDCHSYWPDRHTESPESVPSQTAWAVLALLAAGEADGEAAECGVGYLTRTQGPDGRWIDRLYNAVGFPRVFYLKYHGYAAYFPLWALARYRNLRRNGDAGPNHGN
jgi:squalene-hopene/tetraprenyl-beta-curcumene cyclase